MRTLSSKTIYQNSEAHLVLHVVMEDDKIVEVSQEVHLQDGIYIDDSRALCSFYILKTLNDIKRKLGSLE